MRISTLLRHHREGLRSIWRNGWMSFASISAIAISLFILGSFLMIALNVNKLTEDIENEVEVRVYLDISIDRAAVPQIQNQINAIEGVTIVQFVSKEEGLEFLKERLGEEGRDLLEGQEGDNNPLPDSFTVEVSDPRSIDTVAEKILALNVGQNPEPIYEVNYGADTVRTLFRVTDVIRNIGIVLTIGLTVMSLFLISNTIKVTIVARRREIGIMKLVGATNWFIRWPFFVEGAWLGFIGSLIPYVIIHLSYRELLTYASSGIGFLHVALLPSHQLMPLLLLILMGLGLWIGIFGTVLSVRKFLKV
jgi:cell division transport system permease protein